jgi:hypothetical protein
MSGMSANLCFLKDIFNFGKSQKSQEGLSQANKVGGILEKSQNSQGG